MHEGLTDPRGRPFARLQYGYHKDQQRREESERHNLQTHVSPVNAAWQTFWRCNLRVDGAVASEDEVQATIFSDEKTHTEIMLCFIFI